MKNTTAPKTRSASAQPSPVHHGLDALLHTMRCIAQYEDTLCELSHEVRGAGGLSQRTSDELMEILDKIPAHDLALDLDLARVALAESRTSGGVGPATSSRRTGTFKTKGKKVARP